MQNNEKKGIIVQFFTFNPFQENTYIVYDASGECVIIDPGCYTASEQAQLSRFIADKQLRPVRLLLTHAHLDHIFGCKWVFEQYGLLPECHQGELIVLEHAPQSAARWGVPMAACPTPKKLIEANETLVFGNDTNLKALFVPGHSPASLAFYCEAGGFVIAGDTLFEGAVGRWDLPGGNQAQLLQSIQTQLFSLPEMTDVYAGHGSPTTIRREKFANPFFN